MCVCNVEVVFESQCMCECNVEVVIESQCMCVRNVEVVFEPPCMCVCNVEVRLYLIILQCMNKHEEMLSVLNGPLAGWLIY